ncbi:MAG: sensor histidine kinase [Hyphomonadaceae bacterium]
MANEISTYSSADGTSGRDGAKGRSSRNGRVEILSLRLEVMDLKKRLTAADEVASRSAVMLRECDHRIKNSLQLVASLMRVQARREESVPARNALLSAAARIGSIAGIHDALQSTGGLDLVDLGPVLKKMCGSLQDMAGDDGHIEVRADVETLEIPVLLAQCLVLAVNELVVNALRHAFNDRDDGTVRVTLTRDDGHAIISVIDDGAGLPADHVAGKGYGMKFVKMMVEKMEGELLTESSGGARFTIRAPLPHSLPAKSD